jgi:hypothetical protein
MAEILNLRRARKAKARAKKEAEAEVHRSKFGAAKSVRKLVKARADNERRSLDGARLDEDGPEK